MGYECFKLILEGYMIHLFWKYRNGNEDFTRKETIKLSTKKPPFFKMEVFEQLNVFLQQINRCNNFCLTYFHNNVLNITSFNAGTVYLA
jgi:hypothetical protein